MVRENDATDETDPQVKSKQSTSFVRFVLVWGLVEDGFHTKDRVCCSSLLPLVLLGGLGRKIGISELVQREA